MFLVYELFLGLSRGEETFDFGKCDGFRHDHPWIELPRRSFFPPLGNYEQHALDIREMTSYTRVVSEYKGG